MCVWSLEVVLGGSWSPWGGSGGPQRWLWGVSGGHPHPSPAPSSAAAEPPPLEPRKGIKKHFLFKNRVFVFNRGRGGAGARWGGASEGRGPTGGGAPQSSALRGGKRGCACAFLLPFPVVRPFRQGSGWEPSPRGTQSRGPCDPPGARGGIGQGQNGVPRPLEPRVGRGRDRRPQRCGGALRGVGGPETGEEPGEGRGGSPWGRRAPLWRVVASAPGRRLPPGESLWAGGSLRAGEGLWGVPFA